MSGLTRTIGFTLLAAVATGLVYLSGQPFFVAAGSDATVSILSFGSGIKISALVAFIGSAYSIWFGRENAPLRIVVGILSGLFLTLATHAVIINYKRATIQERWLFAQIDRAPFDVADGLLPGWNVERRTCGIVLHDRLSGKAIYLLTAGLSLPPFLNPQP